MTKKEWALKYASAGIPVFPLHWIKQDGNCSCRLGAMCNGKGKHPLIKNWGEDRRHKGRRVVDEKSVR